MQDPYPALARLRADDPVFRSRELDGLVLTRHEDCAYVLREQALFGNDPTIAIGGMRGHVQETRARSPLGDTPTLGSSDPPVHPRLRGLIGRAFTPRMVEDERPVAARVVKALLDEAPDGQPFEFMSHLAEPLPVIVVSDLLGLDDDERGPVRAWAQALMRVIAGGDLPPEAYREGEVAKAAMLDFLRAYTERHAGDTSKKVISILLEAEAQGDRLSLNELLSFTVFLYTAGSGPTAYMLGNAIAALLAHPVALDAVRADRSLVRRAIEESLRWDSATQVLLRFAREACEVGGRKIMKGDTVYVMVGAAHRDPAVFPQPDTFDIERPMTNAQLLSFGAGPHFCLGQPLAFVQGEVAINALLDRFPRLQVASGGVERGGTFLLRGLRRLPLTGR